MSCSVLCPCQFNWPVDTLGHRRDPVNSEKAWLDFAVRSLSREAVGKGRGQETVWNSACRPAWWDAEVGLQWKNPTANPKDTKEALLQKYEALEHHLKLEGRFPKELEEEARLWSEGKYKELFLLTSFTSLLGKVTGLHSAVLDSSTRAEEMKAEINQHLIKDIKTCLSSTLSAIENINTSKSTRGKKRSSAHLEKADGAQSGKENHVVKKLKKILPSLNQPKSLPIAASYEKSVPHDTNKLLPKCISQGSTTSTLQVNDKKCLSRKRSNMPSLSSKASSQTKTKSVLKATTIEPSVDHKAPEQVVLQVSQEEFDKILQGNFFSLPLPLVAESGQKDYLLEEEQTEVVLGSPSAPVCQSLAPSCESTVGMQSYSPLQGTSNLVTESESGLICDVPSEIVLDQSESIPNSLISVSQGSPLTSTHCSMPDSNVSSVLLSNFQSVSNTITSPVPTVSKDIQSTGPVVQGNSQEMTPRGSPSCVVNSEINVLTLNSNLDTHLPLNSNSRVSSGRAASSNSHHSSTVTDAGYSSDEAQSSEFDFLDSMFNKEEQDQLWREDGSVLLDRFLESF